MESVRARQRAGEDVKYFRACHISGQPLSFARTRGCATKHYRQLHALFVSLTPEFISFLIDSLQLTVHLKKLKRIKF